jgi:ribose transport system ATP-binding protein
MIEMMRVFEARSISNSYGATAALSEVSFARDAREVCGLIGDNGAGKSTSVKALSGVVQRAAGETRLAGAVYWPRDISAARRHGLATFRELSLIPTASAALNLFLPRPAVGVSGLVAHRLEREADLLAAYGVAEIDPAAPVAGLALAPRQRLESMRAMSRRPGPLLLDEPLAALADRELLFAPIACVVAEGTSVNGELLPELNLTAVENGTPAPGATIHKMPSVRDSENLPGVKCENCEPPAD